MPDKKAKLLTLNQVVKRIPLGRSTIWRRVAEGTFPRPRKLGERTTVWLESDIDLLIEELFPNSRGEE